MIAIIPCAGDGQRFTDVGYDVPKSLLPMPDGRQLLDHILDSLPVELTSILIICKSGHEKMIAGNFRSNEDKLHLLPVKRKTRGPLDTLTEARLILRKDDELLINYCDCFLPDNQCSEFVNEMRSRGRHAGVVCFPSHDERFQREPSDKFAMSGIFWFKSSKQFVDIAVQNKDNAELSPGHVAFAIRWMGLNMCAAFITNNIVDLGVPETYQMYLAMHNV